MPPRNPTKTKTKRLAKPCIESIAISKIKPARYNPRVNLKPGDEAFERIKRSLETFGQAQLLVWNKRTGHIVGGHQTFKVLRQLAPGLKELRVSVVDLPLGKEKLLNLALNRTHGRWDEAMLSELMGQMESAGSDLSITGFSEQELDDLDKAMSEVADDLLGGSSTTSQHYGILIDCKDEDHQQTVLKLVESRGTKVRAITHA